MIGIDLNKPMEYRGSSLRFFKENEHHITRFCKEDVLLLVFAGCLRFSENGIPYQINPGEYFIQRKNSMQRGDVPSQSPQYLYVHFLSQWSDSSAALPFRGTFDYPAYKPMIAQLDRVGHSECSLTEKTMHFYQLLYALYTNQSKDTLADKIAHYIADQGQKDCSLEMLCKEFSFSKNYIISIFKEQYKMTPIEYRNHLKIEKAEYLLVVTSNSTEWIAYQSGFNHYSHFYRLFFRKNGMSPKEWRSMKRVQPAAKGGNTGQPRGAPCDGQYFKEGTNGFAKGQGNNGQIVTPKPQDRGAD
ncbi:MAG TPA: AraC family transcriptional regulator [Oscillospiraceae bacterium]|nr:AraC family transcriptional regulator [Clostridia bacterium]HZK24800.1 AraC family transcriptional regulator [Oscillospiraceae bacterium]